MIMKSDLVRQTCQRVVDYAKHVVIDNGKLIDLAEHLQEKKKYLEFEAYNCHLSVDSKPDTILEYLFALDTLNFCFWPIESFEYENLAGNLKALVEKDQDALKPQNLIKMTIDDVKNLIFGGHLFPLLDERLRLLHETASITILHYNGLYSEIIKAANGSSQQLLDILTTRFTGFQDHAIYNGHQVFLYKRSQILIADIYAAFKGKGYGEFSDIHLLTMFPDYRVPQILNQFGVLSYSADLNTLIKHKTVIPHGGEHEVEIRAATVIAVEEIKIILGLKATEIDWILWQLGEQNKDSIVPHHRTLSIYY